MLIKYVRDKYKRPVGVVVAMKVEDSDLAYNIGWSKLNPKDKWDKKVALEIAIGRASVDHKQNIFANLPNDMHPFIEEMDNRGMKYFK